MKRIISIVVVLALLASVAIVAIPVIGNKVKASATDNNKVVEATETKTTQVVDEKVETTEENFVFATEAPTAVPTEEPEEEVSFAYAEETNGVYAIHVFGDEAKVLREAENWDWATWSWLLEAAHENARLWQYVTVEDAVNNGTYMVMNASKALEDFYAVNNSMAILRANGQFVSTKVDELVKVDNIATAVKGIGDKKANDAFTQVIVNGENRWVMLKSFVSDKAFSNVNVEGSLTKEAGFVRADRFGQAIGLQRVANGEYRVVIYVTAGAQSNYVAPKADPVPTKAPVQPTVAPTVAPTAVPTVAPTAVPTVAPTARPTVAPTAKPTAVPTAKPTVAPTAKPTVAPTARPTVAPTARPTVAPTVKPTVAPTVAPTAKPTVKPTGTPAHEPEATLPPKQGTVTREEQETTPAHEPEATLPPKQGTVTREEQSRNTVAPTVAPTAAPTKGTPSHSGAITVPNAATPAPKAETQSVPQTTLPPKQGGTPSHSEEQTPPVMGGITF